MDQLNQEPVRPVRALLRGFEALAALNETDGLTVSAVAKRIGLPRTTVYRLLETLCVGGYAARDPQDDLYRPTARVRALAEGICDEPWVTDIATPLAKRLCKDMMWPVMVSVVQGVSLDLRVITDDMSPVVLNVHTPGRSTDMTQTPAGIVRLAAATPREREALLAAARDAGASEDDCAYADRAAREAAEQGFALDLRPVKGEAGVAVAANDVSGRLRGVMTMRFIKSALTPEAVVSDFVPRLKDAAMRLGAEIPPAEQLTPAATPNPANDARAHRTYVAAVG